VNRLPLLVTSVSCGACGFFSRFPYFCRLQWPPFSSSSWKLQIWTSDFTFWFPFRWRWKQARTGIVLQKL
jgi:hypothetical protein